MLKKRYFNEIRVLQRSLVIEDLLITVALRYATPPTSLRSAGHNNNIFGFQYLYKLFYFESYTTAPFLR